MSTVIRIRNHTLLNEKRLKEAIVRSPEYARICAGTGAQALDTYIRFLSEGLRTAERQLSDMCLAVSVCCPPARCPFGRGVSG